MSNEIRIDKASNSPAYRQIIEQVTSLIRSGDLKTGDRLPAERELAEKLEVARGTVNRAYEELTRSGMLESTPGRGSFVSAKQDVVEPGRKEKALSRIGTLIDELRDLRFSYREILTLVELSVMEREQRFDELAIAVVDCNPETLGVFQKQLGILSRMPVSRILLDELETSGGADRRLANFDLVLTSARHYSELMGLAPGAKEKIIQVALSPSQETIIALASIKPDQKLGIVSESHQFRDIIKNKLQDFMITNDMEDYKPGDKNEFTAFIADRDMVIVPPLWALPLDKSSSAAIQAFTQRGGRFIVFDYQVERGSMIYVEERVRDLLSR